jgi:GMP synthase-like glutamine amidotransferase
MRVLAVVHQPDAGAGVFADAVESAGHELIQWRADQRDIQADPYGAVVVFGGAANTTDEHDWLAREKKVLRALAVTDLPILGVCLGTQLVAEACGGSVRRAAAPEIGWHQVELTTAADEDPVMGGLPQRFDAFQWHSYEAVPPPGSTVLAGSANCLQAWRHPAKPIWGIQFHAEVSLADAERWCDDYERDPDAVALGVDPERMKAELRERHAAWAELGRGICERFLAAAT